MSQYPATFSESDYRGRADIRTNPEDCRWDRADDADYSHRAALWQWGDKPDDDERAPRIEQGCQSRQAFSFRLRFAAL